MGKFYCFAQNVIYASSRNLRATALSVVNSLLSSLLILLLAEVILLRQK